MQQAPVEVQTADGSFLVSKIGYEQFRCQRQTPEGIVDVNYWNDIPSSSWPPIQRAVEDLARSPAFPPAANTNLRWD